MGLLVFISSRVIMSADLQWLLIRNNSSFLLKGLHGNTFSTEPNNLKAKHSFRYNGLVNKKTIGVQPCADGRGVCLVTKKSKHGNKPALQHNSVALKKGNRQVLKALRNTVRKGRYRKDLKMAAMRRACALLKSQKAIPAKSTAKRKNKFLDILFNIKKI